MKTEDEDLPKGDFKEVSLWRAKVYSWFAGLLASELEPADLAEFSPEKIAPLRALLSEYDEDEARTFFDAISAIEPTRENALDLKSDFAACFLLSPDRSAPPYASAYVEEKGRMVGEVAVLVKNMLAEMDFKVKESFKEPEDHVSVILATLVHLIESAADSGFEEAAPVQASFLDKLLLPWLPEWSRRCAEVDVIHPVYPSLARLLLSFVEADREYLST